jgi:hypothetical protein
VKNFKFVVSKYIELITRLSNMFLKLFLIKNFLKIYPSFLNDRYFLSYLIYLTVAFPKALP